MTVKLSNLQTGKVVATLKCGHTDQKQNETSEDSVESVALCRELPLVASATVNGIIEIWDVSTHSRRCLIQKESGISKAMWDVVQPLVIHVAGLDGTISSYDGRSGNLISQFTVHEDQILDCDMASDSHIMVTGSEDGSCCLVSLESNVS